MAKRTRASRSAHRPGGQGPTRPKRTSGAEASAETSAATPVQAEATSPEEIGATDAEVEVDEVAATAIASATAAQATEEPPTGRRARRRVQGRSSKKRGQDDLATRAAAETAWVREDLRRIGVVSIVLIAALAVAYVVFGVIDVLGLY